MPIIADSSTPLIASLDQGTTSTRCILFTAKGDLVQAFHLEHEQHRPQIGWTEHDPIEIRDKAIACIDGAMREAHKKYGITAAQVMAIGITNQRETTIVWDRNTGKPLYSAIVWHDTRTHETCDVLRKKISSEKVRKITGLPISTYFSGVKLLWMMENVPEVKQAVEDGTAMFGTVDTWLVWSLTKEKTHATDITNAGRTMMMNVRTGQWDKKMMDLIGVTEDILPEIRSCSEIYGFMNGTVLDGVPIAGVIGDQQSALVGQSCFSIGQAKNTYGTGCFLIVNTGTQPRFSKSGLLTTPAYKLGPDEECVYSLEGSVANGGVVVRWLRDNMGLFSDAAESEALAESADEFSDIHFVPAFSGLFAPRWDESARGAILGLSLKTNKANIVRAALEGIVCMVNDVLSAAAKDMGEPLAELRVDGGASVNSFLIQTQADLSGLPVVRPKVVETTALGAAFCAGHAKEIGLFGSPEEFRKQWQLDRLFNPRLGEEARASHLRKWEAAVERSLGWLDAGTGGSKWTPSKEVIMAAVLSSCATATVAALLCRYVVNRK